MMEFGFLFGAGAEVGYGLPSGGMFALDIFRHDVSAGKQEFKNMRENVDLTTAYACDWLPDDFPSKNISSFGKSVFQNIIKDTIEHNRMSIINKLNSFDKIAKGEAEKLKNECNIDINAVIEKALDNRKLDNIKMGQKISFIDELKGGNELFNNTYFAAFLMIYKKKGFFRPKYRIEFGKIILSILQLIVGALSEELARKINDNLFQKKDDEIDILDDLGEIIQLNYASSGLSGMEYMLDQQMADLTDDGGKILRFAQMIVESVYASVLDYKSLIDANWHYLYTPKSEWAKFCKICIFLLTVRDYIIEKAIGIDCNTNTNTNGYYHILKEAVDNDVFRVSVVATTNYNQFIRTILNRNVVYLNGSTEMWYDPFVNQIGKREDLDTSEHHILVPLMFTQSGTKPMTSIKMSIQYVDTYNAWKKSDALVVIGFGFNKDDEHINGIVRTLVDKDNKNLIVLSLDKKCDVSDEKKELVRKLKLQNENNVHIIRVDADGREVETKKIWTEAICSFAEDCEYQKNADKNLQNTDN